MGGGGTVHECATPPSTPNNIDETFHELAFDIVAVWSALHSDVVGL